jgi:hypothetical protein
MMIFPFDIKQLQWLKEKYPKKQLLVSVSRRHFFPNL